MAKRGTKQAVTNGAPETEVDTVDYDFSDTLEMPKRTRKLKWPFDRLEVVGASFAFPADTKIGSARGAAVNANKTYDATFAIRTMEDGRIRAFRTA